MLDLTQTPITLALLVVNVVVSVLVLRSRPQLINTLAFRPERILRHGEIYRLVTAGFVHVNGAHLLVNMLTLYFFGPWLELTLGPIGYLILYFGSELAAHGLSLVIHRRSRRYSAVGASGAITGVLFAFCLYEPFRMLYLFFAIPIPAIVFAIGFVAISLYAMQGRDPNQVGGLAHEAHLGGAIGGVLVTVLLDPRALPLFLQQVGL
ncbi:Membrane associated serine protease, rhomboid family [Modicisalibacter ilicicola DSM 19980]|uniref:Membrane associated serine protease, rhomboid family n=1 Tax=Modicisalibacter ilicicola DSM 19980 TaxID=1121942 RepID=A0A1M4Z9U3_9GAMM|nr:rhomboid family intramembrane serine protease [Halomonas ilicicola]SHF14784.1 Membrane associated serine protease, rhomboid family [Halomonas ilicicola DSM 19980]